MDTQWNLDLDLQEVPLYQRIAADLITIPQNEDYKSQDQDSIDMWRLFQIRAIILLRSLGIVGLLYLENHADSSNLMLVRLVR